jgi:hypothetical protein
MYSINLFFTSPPPSFISSKRNETAKQCSLEGTDFVYSQIAAVQTQLVQDSLDILLPAGTLGYHHLDDGVLGLVGFVTSLMGLRSQVGKVLGVGMAAK